MNQTPLWLALLCSLASCYFAAGHSALKAYSRKRLAELLAARNREARAQRIADRTNDLLLMTGAARACLNLVTLLALLFYFDTHYGHWSIYAQYAAAFAITGVLVCVFSVAIPVSWARHARERLLASTATMLLLGDTLTRPLTWFLHLFDSIVKRISDVTGNGEDDSPDLSEQVLSAVEDHHENESVDEEQKEMLEAVFELPTTTAGEVMTPRTDVIGIEASTPPQEALDLILREGHSRIPVFRESLDQIVGVLYVKDLIRYLRPGAPGPLDLTKNLREPFMVPESKPISDLLSDFKKRKVHLAIVLDEYGGTAGVVTIEDILEELVGEIQDEYERNVAEPMIRPLDGNAFEVEGRVEIDNFQDALGLTLPEERDYDTVGGFVFATLGHIPKEGESFEHGNLRVTVTAAEPTRVKTVRVERFEVQPANDADGPNSPV